MSTPRLLSRLDAADCHVLHWIARRRAPSLVRIMRVVTRTGDALFIAAALAVAVACRPGRTSALITLSTLAALAAFWCIKRLVRRSRPELHVLMAAPDRFSMPSGHATCAWALAVACSILLPAAALPICGWAIAVSLSRVVLAVHYPFDVLAGSALGSAAALVVVGLLG